jgi:hypothetical protein
MSLESFVDTLNLSWDNRSSTLAILERECVTTQQLLSSIDDEELEEIGICSEARSAIAAARNSPPVSMPNDLPPTHPAAAFKPLRPPRCFSADYSRCGSAPTTPPSPLRQRSALLPSHFPPH